MFRFPLFLCVLSFLSGLWALDENSAIELIKKKFGNIEGPISAEANQFKKDIQSLVAANEIPFTDADQIFSKLNAVSASAEAIYSTMRINLKSKEAAKRNVDIPLDVLQIMVELFQNGIAVEPKEEERSVHFFAQHCHHGKPNVVIEHFIKIIKPCEEAESAARRSARAYEASKAIRNSSTDREAQIIYELAYELLFVADFAKAEKTLESLIQTCKPTKCVFADFERLLRSKLRRDDAARSCYLRTITTASNGRVPDLHKFVSSLRLDAAIMLTHLHACGVFLVPEPENLIADAISRLNSSLTENNGWDSVIPVAQRTIMEREGGKVDANESTIAGELQKEVESLSSPRVVVSRRHLYHDHECGSLCHVDIGGQFVSMITARDPNSTIAQYDQLIPLWKQIAAKLSIFRYPQRVAPFLGSSVIQFRGFRFPKDGCMSSIAISGQLEHEDFEISPKGYPLTCVRLMLF